ncbi:MAG: hypothetical protein QME52_04630 [Bacteroidota bacterium]|nr:hypothetical protein [Bacteroidota bacterium]
MANRTASIPHFVGHNLRERSCLLAVSCWAAAPQSLPFSHCNAHCTRRLSPPFI